jgi:hypothetical protein
MRPTLRHCATEKEPDQSLFGDAREAEMRVSTYARESERRHVA